MTCPPWFGRCSDESRDIPLETGGSQRTCTPTLQCSRAGLQRRGEAGSGDLRGNRRHVSSAERGEADRAGVKV